jgi:hypothetical protein
MPSTTEFAAPAMPVVLRVPAVLPAPAAAAPLARIGAFAGWIVQELKLRAEMRRFQRYAAFDGRMSSDIAGQAEYAIRHGR